MVIALVFKIMKIISISNQKGGVGKTTTAINIAAAMTYVKRRVLLIDMDPQGNATSGSGIEKNSLVFSVNEVLLGEVKVKQAIIQPSSMKYHLLPADNNLTSAELTLVGMQNRENQLKNVLKDIDADTYDIAVIDSPPTLNLLTLNSLVAANSVIIPVQCEYYSLEGLSSLLQTIDGIQKTLNKELVIDGVIRTMYDPRTRLSRDVSNQLFKYFQNKVMKTTIPRTIRLAEAPSYGKSIVDYDQGSMGSLAYMAMANELLQRKII